MDKKTTLTGFSALNSASVNKGTAFSLEERQYHKLRGLLPPKVVSPEIQLERTLKNMRRKQDDIEKYVFLTALQARNEKLFYTLVIKHIEEVMPLIYTPTVGQACKEYAHMFRRPRGMYITVEDKGEIKEVLENWPYRDIKIIVVTDGERILGLGDLGSNGIGIPIGKLALYVACAGIKPHQCLPIMLDVGTNNVEFHHDAYYLGLNQNRIVGDEYNDFIDEFIQGVKETFPEALIQFEDFLTPNAYALLNKYRNEVLCFNDDIQGTASVALAGIYASIRISGSKFKDMTIMFLGAGSAATGIADLLCYALQQEGLTGDEARQRLWFVDPGGLLVKGRSKGILPHNEPYMHDYEQLGFIDAINDIKPNVLIGATGSPNTFTHDVVEAMSKVNERPTIFALSNPTSRAECTAMEAYDWSEGRVIFASGSPFPPVDYGNKELTPGQGNNVYIFPGIGLGAIISETTVITEDMFLTAAQVLADQVTQEDFDKGMIYPPLKNIREVSYNIALAVAEHAYAGKTTKSKRPDDLENKIKDYMYDPNY
ncbi:MAG TPA: NAD-dependent malic enzyme [Thiotrichaceae bacterium]|jgi:malate dehydrogenase (oxaloacetate-decarboxylating)(NADP+)|nr:NAD-dependent malic enzyme [Thiotrichaceae bacterium]HIM08690.1 NAD-dependent malic enzyme [Gammaproteobacteria bacterium]